MQRVIDITSDSNNEESKGVGFPIVGIGASAGGLEAITQLLKSLPADLGMGFVVVQHLDPTHESVLADLLSKATTMPVLIANENLQISPNHVYVIPYNKDISILNGILKLSGRRENGKIHMPIDLFFTSLAQEQKENAIGVVLSGTATDGTIGCKAIKENGGITFAQDSSAKYQDMPQAAAAGGYIDFVLSPDAIA
ncbi:MAG TPA: chemotaxis protein CheB, partial [Clostridia bacterium]